MARSSSDLPKLPRGEGSFQWMNDAHTMLRYFKVYKPKSGLQSVRLTVTAPTVAECMELMRRKEREIEDNLIYDNQDDLDSPVVFLAKAMLDWLKLTKYNSRKATAYDREERTIQKQIAAYPIGKKKVVEVTAWDITKHLNYLQSDAQKGKGYSYSTVKKVYEALNQFFKYYYSKNLNDNPMNQVPAPENKKNVGEISLDDKEDGALLEDVVLSDSEIETFRQFVFQEPRVGVAGRTRHGVALYFMILTCLRGGEAITLTWDDIDFEKKTLRVNKTTSRVINRQDGESKTRLIITKPKTAKAVRTVPLNDNAIQALLEIRARSSYTSPKDFVISTDTGERVTIQNLRKYLKGVLKAAGLNNAAREKHFGVHYLRHTGISYYLRHGVPVDLVSRMVGHANVAITTQTYYHIVKDQEEQLLNAIQGL